MTIKSFQKCHADRRVFSIAVPSQSDPDALYAVGGVIIQGEIGCSCPAFKFKGQCKHFTMIVDSCGWSAVSSPEPQTMSQKMQHKCPRCGGITMDEVVGMNER